MRLLSFPELAELKGINLSRVQIWRLYSANRFPRPIPISTNRVAWSEAEIDQWIADRIAARDAAPRRRKQAA